MEITVTKFRAQDAGAVIAVSVAMEENGEKDTRVFRILPEQYAALHLRVGAIDRETEEAIEQASALCEAIRKGMALLGYGAHSERALTQKLRLHGFPSDVSAGAAAYLSRQGLMDERGDARRIVEQCLRKRWGLRRVLSCLFEKGYPEDVVRGMEESLADYDFESACLAMIRSRFPILPDDRREREKVVASMMRYGYTLPQIRHAMAMATAEECGEEE